MDVMETGQEYWYWYLLFAIEILLIIIILVIGYALIKRRQKILLEEKALRFKNLDNLSLQELVDEAKKQKLDKPLDVAIGSGAYSMDKSLKINSPIRLVGQGADETRIESKQGGPAISIENVKNCSVSNMTIRGSIQCANSDLQIENCQIIANEDGICIEAVDGSTVTVSGLVRGEGGIAIRAQGESKVILKQPYVVSGDDYVVMDPKSKVEIEKKEKQALPENNMQ